MKMAKFDKFDISVGKSNETIKIEWGIDMNKVIEALRNEISELKEKVNRLESGMREIYSRLELALKELKLLREKENEAKGFEGTDPK
jgi:prefoldin subunit 5